MANYLSTASVVDMQLLAETMGVAEKLVRQPPMSFPEESSEGEDAMYPSSKVSTLCSAVPTVYLPGIPVQSVCEVRPHPTRFLNEPWPSEMKE